MGIKTIKILLISIWRYRKIISFRQVIKLFIADKKTKELDPIPIKLKSYPHPFWVRPGTTDISIFRHIFLLKEYPPIKNAKNYIIDAGANIGAASFYFKMKSPNAKIIAIEPESSNCDLYRLNMKPFKDVQLLQVALHHTAHQFMKIENPNTLKYSFRMQFADDGVKTVSINYLMKEYKIEKIDLVKIDIEGGEKAVFEKNIEWIDQSDIVILELHEHYVEGCSTAVINAFANRKVKLSWNKENLIFTKYN